MHRIINFILVVLCISTLCSCTIWQIATTTNRKGPWTMEAVERYAEKFPHVDRLCFAGDLGWQGSIEMGYNVFHESGRKIKPAPPVNGCPDPQYDYFFFKSLADGMYDDGDFIDTMVSTSYIAASGTTLDDIMLKRAIYTDTIQVKRPTHFSNLRPSLSAHVYSDSLELSAPFTVVIPFVLSGQRRIQTVLIKEYLEAVRKANGDGKFEVWMVYVEGDLSGS